MQITPITTIGLYNSQKTQKTTTNKTIAFEGRKNALPKMCFYLNGSTLSEAAKAERKLHGTTTVSGKLIEKVTPRLQEMGYQNLKTNNFRDLWVFKDKDDTKGHHIVSYFDSKNDASILLTEDSDKAYMVKYKRAKTAYAEPLQAYYTKEYDFKTKMWKDVDPENFTPEAPFCYEG